MPICAKCNTSIKPASLATTSGEDNFHPTCISCSRCDRPLWGRGFRRNKQRKLECDPDCEPRPPSAPKQTRPPEETQTKGFKPIYDDAPPMNQPMNSPPQSYRQPTANNQPPQNYQQQQPTNYDLNMYRRQGTEVNGAKNCKSCGQSLQNRRFLTYENGDSICQECDFNSRNPIVKTSFFQKFF